MRSSPYWISASQSAERRWAETLSEISHSVNAGATEREVGDMIARASTLLTGVDRAAVALADLDGQGLRLVGAHGLTTDYIDYLARERPLHFRADPELEGAGPSIRGFRSGRAVAIPDITTDPAFEPWRKLASAEGFRSILAVPLIAAGEPLGVLTCYCNDPGQLEQSQSELIESLAVHAAIVLETFQLRRSQDRSIEELTDTLDILQRDRTLHTTLMKLVLDGARPAEIVDVASDVLAVHVQLTDTPADADRSVQLGTGGTAPEAWLVVPDPLSSSERLALEAVGLVVALELQRQISVFEAEMRNKLDLLGDILALDEHTDATELLDRARRHGFELDRPHRLVILAPDTPVQGGARRLAQLAHHLAPATRPQGLMSYRNNTAVLLLPVTDEYAEFASRLHIASQRELGSTTCSMVVGTQCDSLGDYGTALRTAAATLDLRQRSGSRGQLAELDQLGTLQFLLQGPPAELIAFSQGVLAPLTDGAAQASDLLETLKAYLANRQRAGATARALHVHPNTISNRLERIGRLTGGSVDDSEHLLNLKLALLVHDVTNS